MSVAVTARRGRLVEIADRPGRQEFVESLLSVTSGGLGVRAVSEAAGEVRPAARVNNCYGSEPPGKLLVGPDFVPRVPGGRGLRWRLEPRRGVVEHDLELPGGDLLTTTRFASAALPGVWVYSADGPASEYLTNLPGNRVELGPAQSTSASICVAEARAAGGVLRVAAVEGDGGPGAVATRRGATGEALAMGAADLLSDHERTWQRRWDDAEISIKGAPQDELGVQFALYHLLSLAIAPGAGELGPQPGWELAVGARGLTGPAYAGHVFWDAEAYVLPALSALDPQAGAAMLAYRLHRLDAARAQARAEGRPGARYPWESAASGVEVTPQWVILGDGRRIEVHTGAQEIHINSDIAWAAVHHSRWTGDAAGLLGRDRPLVTETAAYLAERIELDPHGRGHLRGVIGPDEYHESVTDNVFTNVMARWHLRAAAELSTDPREAARWRQLAGCIVNGYLPEVRRHEQFAGFDQLIDVRAADYGQPPYEAGAALAAVGATQIVKQADVIMAHHLIPEAMPAGSAAHDLAHYLPRTSHGSSLSPAIHASVLARSGQPEAALAQLRLALRLDLDDLTGTSTGGVHLATMGGVWQAVAFGFLGLRVDDQGRVTLDPCLPAAWEEVRLNCWVRGFRVAVRADHRSAELTADGPLVFRGAGGAPDVTGVQLELRGGWGHWQRAGANVSA